MVNIKTCIPLFWECTSMVRSCLLELCFYLPKYIFLRNWLTGFRKILGWDHFLLTIYYTYTVYLQIIILLEGASFLGVTSLYRFILIQFFFQVWIHTGSEVKIQEECWETSSTDWRSVSLVTSGHRSGQEGAGCARWHLRYHGFGMDQEYRQAKGQFK